MLKLAALIAVFAAVGGWVRDSGALQQANLLGSCTRVAAPAGDLSRWYACREGMLTGYPSLSRGQCTLVGVVGAREVWRCSGLEADDGAPPA